MGKKVVIAGGSGFLGISLASFLVERGIQVAILSRSQPILGDWTHIRWDGRTRGNWKDDLERCDAIINLAGLLQQRYV